jgi:hypothetical protein
MHDHITHVVVTHFATTNRRRCDGTILVVSDFTEPNGSVTHILAYVASASASPRHQQQKQKVKQHRARLGSGCSGSQAERRTIILLHWILPQRAKRAETTRATSTTRTTSPTRTTRTTSTTRTTRRIRRIRRSRLTVHLFPCLEEVLGILECDKGVFGLMGVSSTRFASFRRRS